MSLLSHFCRRIRMTGPLHVAELMHDVIMDPKHGYYPQAASIGHKGDFITAPELTPVFGEIIGAWSLLYWQQAKLPPKIHFTELGPGRGTLMRDIIDTVGIIGPAFFGKAPKLSASLVELSEKFIAEQEEMLCGNVRNTITPQHIFDNHNYLSRTGLHKAKFKWYSMLDHAPDDKPSLYIMNEFLDALPVNQFQKTEEKGWVEIMVDVEPDMDKLFYTTYKTGKSIKIDQDKEFALLPVGSQIEHSPASDMLVTSLAERIAKSGGAALIIDYGEDQLSTELTFRAFKNHQQVNPLEDLGLCDLTADVNFKDLKKSIADVKGVKAHGPITQSSFLTLMGVGERFKQLYSQVPEDKQDSVIHAHNFLCSPDEMGDRFKVLCITRESDPVPFCFEGSSS
ncbi:protein arginine methyltransferase NDUFAF7, mitochondrial-like [Bolinopsis microptera]|uniref:protein arginine methyltransferase NDUFAF7, mitochondrial-like n=1 Tax=Bolinopsis microptera TaxID=2820187 RepID=UPI00307AFAD4